MKMLNLKLLPIVAFTILLFLPQISNAAEEKNALETENIQQSFLITEVKDNRFTYHKRKLLKNLSTTENPQEKYIFYSDLAKLYFDHGLHTEAISIYNLIADKFPNFFQNDYKSQFFLAVSLSLEDKIFEAKKILEKISKISTSYEQERALWYNYTLAFSQSKKLDQKLLLQIDEQIYNQYPQKIYCKIYKKILQQLLISQKNQLILKLTENKTDDISKYYSSLAKYYLEDNVNHLLENLQPITLSEDQDLAYQTELKLIEIKRENNKISLEDAIKILRNLNYKTLSNPNIRYDLLDLLANYLASYGNIIESLQIHSYLDYNYEKLSNELFSKKIHAENFIKIFGQENISDLDKISAFYNFQNLIPINQTGNQIIFDVVKSLLNLNLFTDAIALLDHQIKFKFKGPEKVKASFLLAKLYIKEKEFNKSLAILNNLETSNQEFKAYQKILLLKAKNFLYLNQYDRALSILENIEGKNLLELQKKIFFAKRDYTEYLNHLIQTPVVFKNLNIKNQIKLIVAYYALDKQKDLQNIQNQLNSEQKVLKNIVELFLLNLDNKFDPTCTLKAQTISNNIYQKILNKFS